jgi:ADP-ribosyl-[dinitrogen reductase] hydrolase
VSALHAYKSNGDPFAGSTNPRAAGNGCIMRLAPVPMFFFPDLDAAERYSAESSRTTHGAAECLDACRLLGRIICRALMGKPKNEVLFGDSLSFVGADRIMAISKGSWVRKSAAEIRGSGYVVDSLEAALWSFWSTESFRDAILTAVNLGDDADTTASVCGQVAGAYFGELGIPASWLEHLAMRRSITRLADQLSDGLVKSTLRIRSRGEGGDRMESGATK